MEVEIECPYCGEPVEVWIDPGGGSSQRYVEDCWVCCRPIDILVSASEDGEPQVEARRLDE